MSKLRRFIALLCLLMPCAWANASFAPPANGWASNGAAASCSSSGLDSSFAQCIISKVNSISDTSKLDQCTFINVTASSATAQCHFIPNNNFLSNGSANRVLGACPANSTGTTSCTCAVGYAQPNGTGSSCVPIATCTPGATQSSGYYDIGQISAGAPPMGVCSNGCLGTFDGTSPAGSALVNGVKHWFAKGKYVNFGSSCDSGNGSGNSGGSGTAPSASAAVPGDSCASGDAMGSVNGVKTCVSAANANGTTTAPPVPPKTIDQSTTTTTTNADNSVTTTTTTVHTNSDGSTGTTTTATTKNPDGSPRGTTTTTSGSVGGSSPGSPDGTGTDPCTVKPMSTGCGGTATDADASKLYTAKTATVQDLLQGASNTLSQSPIGQVMTGFFSVSGGGSCPAAVWNISYFHTSVTMDSFCTQFAVNMLAVIKAVLLLVASFMAFRIAMGDS